MVSSGEDERVCCFDELGRPILEHAPNPHLGGTVSQPPSIKPVVEVAVSVVLVVDQVAHSHHLHRKPRNPLTSTSLPRTTVPHCVKWVGLVGGRSAPN